MKRGTSDACFALGVTAIFFSTLTQLRSPSLNIGAGEVCGALSLFLFLTQRVTANVARVLPALCVFFIGYVVGFVANQILALSQHASVRDFVAPLFSSLVALTVAALCARGGNRFQALLLCLDALVIIHLIPLVLVPLGIELAGWLGDTQGETIFAPGGSRYVGLSENPHQLGIFLCFFYFLAGYSRGRARWRSTLKIVALAGSLVLGYLTLSYTLLLAVLGGFSALALAHFVFTFRTSLRTRAGFLVVLCAVGVGISLSGGAVFSDAYSAMVNKTEEGDASSRFPLWANSISAFAESYGLGLGPGAHSGLSKPFEGNEAHNTILDIAQQGGVVSLAAYGVLLFLALKGAIDARSPVAVGIAAAVLIEQMAHYTLRQPLGWLPIFLLIFWS